MNKLHETIERLCADRGTTITEMCRVSGAARGSLTDLKKGRISSLSADTLSKIASYFGVTVDYLLCAENETAPAVDAEADDEMGKILQEFKDNPDLRALFSLSRNATPAELRQYADVIRALRGNRDE